MVVLSWLFGYPTSANDAARNKPPSPTSPPVSPPAPLPSTSAATPHQEPASPPPQPDYRSHFLSQRSLRQLGLFLGGAGFFYWSLMLSRRAITRHQLASQLKFYQPSHQYLFRSSGSSAAAAPPKRDPLVAVEALNLATLNTLTFAMAAVGGVAWAFDISSVEELRRVTRRSIVETDGVVDEEAEREVVEWVAKTFGIEERKEGGGGGEEGERKGT
jgi:hypothetical protein